MASGLPVVSFNYAASREYIRSGENGMAAPLYDEQAFIQASITLAINPTLRENMGKAAYQTALGLGWERVVQRLHTTIQSVLRETSDETVTPA